MKSIGLALALMTLFGPNTNARTQERLEACRHNIDGLDQRIVQLIQQQAREVEEVGNIKREAHLPVMVSSREKQVVDRARDLAKGGPLPPDAVGRIYQKIVEEMRQWEAGLDAAATPRPAERAAATGSRHSPNPPSNTP